MADSSDVRQLLKEIRDLRDWDIECGLNPRSMEYLLPSDKFELLVGCPKTIISDDGVSIYGIRVVESVLSFRKRMR